MYKKTTLVVTKYPTHFEAVMGSYGFISESEVQAIDIAAGEGQGVRYIRSKNDVIAVVFRSENLEDLHQIQLNNGWSNNVNAIEAKPGITVYVIGNADVRKKYPGTVGVKYTLKNLPYKEIVTDKQWASEA